MSNAGVIVLCFVALLSLVMWLSYRSVHEHIEESVDAELAMLAGEFRIDGPAGLTYLVAERVRHDSARHERYYRLERADGVLLAGNLTHWPEGMTARQGRHELPSPARGGRTSMVASWARMPDGSRLLVAFDEYELRHLQRKLRQGAIWSLLAVLVMSWFAGRFITRSALRPIGTIRESARQIMLGDLRHRIPLQGSGDEFDQLARTLNNMLDRIAQLIAGIEGTTDNIAHDLRSPLTRHRARLEAALAVRPTEGEWTAWVERHLADIDQILSTFQSLLKIARIDAGILRSAFTVMDLAALCHDAAEFMEPLAESRAQHLRIDLPGHLPVAGHRDLLFQLLTNLLDNAIKYSPPGSDILLSGALSGDHCLLTLRDHGPGIPAEQRERVFERLYRLDSTRMTPGLGLGLSLARAVIQLHEGSITLADASPGLLVEIRLPASGGSVT